MTGNQSNQTVYSECRAREQTHVCSKCGGMLKTIYDDGYDEYESVCATDGTHRGFKRKLASAEVVKRGELDKELGQGVQAATEQALQQPGVYNPLMPREDVATRIPLTPTTIRMLQQFAADIGLKFHLGHVCLYQGHPYITIDGYYYLKNQRGYAFAVHTAPMTDKQRTAYRVGEGDHAYIAEAITAGGDVLNRGIGIVTADEMNKPSKNNPDSFAAPVVHNKPQIMAEKRAEWQLLQKMVPLGVDTPMPQGEALKPPPAKPATQEEIDLLWPG